MLIVSYNTARAEGPRLTAGALASPATRVGESTLKRTRTVQGVVLVRSVQLTYTHTHMRRELRHGGGKAIRHVSPSSTHGTLPHGRSQAPAGPGSHPTISLCLGIIRSWGASHPARIHIRFTSRFAQRLCEGLHRFPEAAAILEHIGHLRVPDRTLSVSRHVRFITLCGRTMHRDRIPTSHWQCPDPTPSPRHVRAPRP